MADPERCAGVLRGLSDLGVQIAIDDFGTGFSSLVSLRSLPVDVIKIDKSFVLHMATNDNDDAIVRSTVDLGRSLGLRVVAEGVENEVTVQRLRVLRLLRHAGLLPQPPAAGRRVRRLARHEP